MSTTPICDALRDSLCHQEGCDWLKDFTDLAERLEVENAAMAQVLHRVADHFMDTDAPLGIDARALLAKRIKP